MMHGQKDIKKHHGTNLFSMLRYSQFIFHTFCLSKDIY